MTTMHMRHGVGYVNAADFVAARLNEYDLCEAPNVEGYDLPQFIADNLDHLVDVEATAFDENGDIVLWDGDRVVYKVGRYFRGWVARR